MLHAAADASLAASGAADIEQQLPDPAAEIPGRDATKHQRLQRLLLLLLLQQNPLSFCFVLIDVLTK